MKPKIGDFVQVDNRMLVVTGFKKNVNDETIVMWTHKKDTGGCMPGVWQEWVKGFDSRRRRGLKTKFDYRF